MVTNKRILPVLVLLAGAPGLRAQDPPEPAPTPAPTSVDGTFDAAAATARKQLEDAVAELDRLREEIAGEKIPLSRKLGELEAELARLRLEHQSTSRLLDGRTLDLANLGSEIRSREAETAYLANLLSEYIRNFESRLHIAEIHRYEEPLQAAKLAAENTNLGAQEVFGAQVALLAASLERLHDALGGTSFEGTAVDPSGVVEAGTFVLIGPAAIFRSADGRKVGTAEQRLGSLEPAQIPFADSEDAGAAAQLVAGAAGSFPLDPTLGNAHKIEATQETFWEHVRKGGPVMVPIFALAAAALLVALYKWTRLAVLRRPSRKQVAALLDAVARRDEGAARERAAALKGPVGKMLAAGVEHLREPRELIEEMMYERVLTTRLALERGLSFIAISAASAPLLGLLGTVTGIITTFKLITVFGSGDVKTLSGGISEALITTEFGLIVAIPSLLLHAFLSRKVRGIIGQMETAAVGLVNQVSKSYGRNDDDEREEVRTSAPRAERDRDKVIQPRPRQVREELEEEEEGVSVTARAG